MPIVFAPPNSVTIALYIRYYNTERIHTKIRMSSTAYAAMLMPTKRLDKVSGGSRG